jgi:dienelactone hydrolase
MPVYMLIPKNGTQPLPVVLAFHGHGYGVKDIVGLWEDGNERDGADGIYKDFGVALCRKGFAVAAPEISCFGERQTDFSYLNPTIGQSAPASTCDHTAKLAFSLGGSALGLRILDSKRLIDYVETRSEIDAQRMGTMGLSGGGMVAFFASGLDKRIKAVVISGYYSTFKDSILAMHHCTCNFVPGLHQFGEMYDLVGLIAPRPLLVESGSYDPIFPRKAVMHSVEIARTRVYNIFGASQNVETDYFEGRHCINGERAYDFLAEHLFIQK